MTDDDRGTGQDDRNGKQNTQEGTALGVIKVAFGAFLLRQQEIGAVILPRGTCKKVGQRKAVNPD